MYIKAHIESHEFSHNVTSTQKSRKRTVPATWKCLSYPLLSEVSAIPAAVIVMVNDFAWFKTVWSIMVLFSLFSPLPCSSSFAPLPLLFLLLLLLPPLLLLLLLPLFFLCNHETERDRPRSGVGHRTGWCFPCPSLFLTKGISPLRVTAGMKMGEYTF